ncbi:hypothetical protein QUA58_15580, partial [Microcoleus sp. N9_A1]
ISTKMELSCSSDYLADAKVIKFSFLSCFTFNLHIWGWALLPPFGNSQDGRSTRAFWNNYCGYTAFWEQPRWPFHNKEFLL